MDTYRKIIDGDTPAPLTLKPGEALTLNHALALANRHNERLSLQGEEYLQALIQKDVAFAGFLPQVSFGSNIALIDVPHVDQAKGRYSGAINGSINLFRGFADQAAMRRAGFTIEQQKALLLDLEATVLLDVAQTYYQVLRRQQQVDVLINSLKLQDERVRDALARQKAGLIRTLDVAQTQAQAAATRAILVQARADVRNGRSVLAFLIGQPVVDGPLVDEFVPPDQLPAEPISQDQALQSRQDLLAAQKAVDAARANVDIAVAQYYPSVNFNASRLLFANDFANAGKWDAVLSANLPIFSAGLIHNSVRTAWSQLRQAALSESLLKRQILQDVQVAYENLTSSRKKIVELQTEVTAAAEALRQADESYKVGLATNLERLTAQDQLLSAELALTSEQFNAKIFFLDLQRTTGLLPKQLPLTPTTQPSGK